MDAPVRMVTGGCLSPRPNAFHVIAYFARCLCDCPSHNYVQYQEHFARCLRFGKHERQSNQLMKEHTMVRSGSRILTLALGLWAGVLLAAVNEAKEQPIKKS